MVRAWQGECQCFYTQTSFQLITFTTFIADHNSAFENFLMLEQYIINRLFGRSPRAHKSASSEPKATIFACTLNFSILTDRKSVEEDVVNHAWLVMMAFVRSMFLIQRLNSWEFVIFVVLFYKISSFRPSVKEINVSSISTGSQSKHPSWVA